MRGVVVIDVDAVEDAVELAVHDVDDALQAVRVVGIVQFARVGRGDGGNGVGHEHGALHEVDVVAALILIAQTAVVPALGQGEDVLHLGLAELALIGDVVDGIDGLDGLELVAQNHVVLEVDDGEGGLPVVAVEDLRHEVEVAEQVDDGAAEEREAQRVIAIAIQARAMEKVLILDEPDGDAVQLAAKEGAGHDALPEAHLALLDLRERIAVAFAGALIERHDGGDLIAGLFECRRQGEGDVRQAAGLAEGCAFAGHKQDFHRDSPFHENDMHLCGYDEGLTRRFAHQPGLL